MTRIVASEENRSAIAKVSWETERNRQSMEELRADVRGLRRVLYAVGGISVVNLVAGPAAARQLIETLIGLFGA